MTLLLQLLAGFVVFATFWATIPRFEWWFRVADFPRNQLIFLGVVALIGLLWLGAFDSRWQIGLILLLLIALAMQAYMVLPYTFLWKKQVQTAKPKSRDYQVKLLVANVLTTNPNKQALIDLIHTHQPDIVLTLETDQAWQDALSPIEADYPFNVNVPLDNLYGMHLYSKLELINPQVKYLVVDDIPSIHTQVRLAMGKVVWLYCLHPMPPSPTCWTATCYRSATKPDSWTWCTTSSCSMRASKRSLAKTNTSASRPRSSSLHDVRAASFGTPRAAAIA